MVSQSMQVLQCALVLLLLQPQKTLAALRSYNLTLNAGTRAPDGVKREVYLVNGQQPGPLIEADEGDDLEIFVQNDLPVEQTIHWHGLLQRGTPDMDGVPGITQFPIPPGGNFTYRFSTGTEYGAYWYHSHFRAYYDDAVRGPLLIHPSPSRRRPFESLAQDSKELDTMLRVERAATPLLLADWYHRLSDVIYDEYLKTGAFPQCVDSLLANGYGRVQCLPESVLQAGPGLGIESFLANDPHDPVNPMSTPPAAGGSGMSMDSTSSSEMPMETVSSSPMSMDSSMTMRVRQRSEHMSMTGDSATAEMNTLSATSTDMAPAASMSSMPDMMSTLGPKGCSPPMMFKPGFDKSSLPPETCTNTTSEQLVLNADTSQGWTAFHLVNAGAVSRLSVSLDGHSFIVYAADGLYVEPQKAEVIHITIGQRYSVMVRLDQMPGNYNLRFASYPYGDMQQVIEGQAILSYQVNGQNATNLATMDDPALPWALVNGSAKLTAAELDEQTLAPFDSSGPPSGPSAVTKLFAINQTDVVTWVIDGQPFLEPSRPIIYGNASDGWEAATSLHLPGNSTIDLIMHVANDSMDTMGHPIHLHGHKFWFLGSGTGMFPYRSVTEAPSNILNLQNPPYRDTIDLPPSGWAVIRYVTDNPGAWFLHCHVQWHLVSGMAVVLIEDQERLGQLVGSIESAANYPNATASTSVGTSLVRPNVVGSFPLSAILCATIVGLTFY